jgi:hypothetical protein
MQFTCLVRAYLPRRVATVAGFPRSLNLPDLEFVEKGAEAYAKA